MGSPEILVPSDVDIPVLFASADGEIWFDIASYPVKHCNNSYKTSERTNRESDASSQDSSRTAMTPVVSGRYKVKGVRKLPSGEPIRGTRASITEERLAPELFEEAKFARPAAESSLDAMAKDLRRARLEADRLNDQIKMLLEHNSTLQAYAVKGDEVITKLINEAEAHKQVRGEKDQLLSRILELEMQLDAKHELEEENLIMRKKIEELNQELDDKIEDLDHLRDMNQALIVTERKMNDVVQKVHSALIMGLKVTRSRRVNIGIKRMGEIDCKPFENACKKIFPRDDAELEAAKLLTKWQDELKSQAWHPYKRIMVDGKEKEDINEEDEKLQGLKNELGEEVYTAVSKALLEMNEHNPSGKYPVQELWHFREDRVAYPGEVVQYVFKTHKRKRS